MRINITATKLVLTPALRTFIEQKLGSVAKLLKRFETKGERELFVEVARTTAHHRHGDVFYAEVTLELPGKTFRIEETDPDARIAIDRVKDRLKADLAAWKSSRSPKRAGRSRS